jgi:hypothetical protein
MGHGKCSGTRSSAVAVTSTPSPARCPLSLSLTADSVGRVACRSKCRTRSRMMTLQSDVGLPSSMLQSTLVTAPPPLPQPAISPPPPPPAPAPAHAGAESLAGRGHSGEHTGLHDLGISGDGGHRRPKKRKVVVVKCTFLLALCSISKLTTHAKMLSAAALSLAAVPALVQKWQSARDAVGTTRCLMAGQRDRQRRRRQPRA